VGNDNVAQAGSPESQGASSVGQTANIGRSTSVAGGAAKVFREFKWGLLTLFLLMVVVIGLVYDGGRKKKGLDTDAGKTAANPEINIDPADSLPPPTGAPTTSGTPGASSAGTDLVDPTNSGGSNMPPPNTNSPATTSHNGPSVDAPEPQVAMPNTGSGRTLTPPAPGLGETHLLPTPAGPAVAGAHPATPTDHAAKSKHADTKASEKDKEAGKAPAGPERSYVVQSGDTLTKIANKELPGKGGVKAILAANKDVLADANRLKVGMTLKIPAAVPTAVTPTEAVAKKKSDSKATHSTSSIMAENPAEKSEKLTEVAASKDGYTVQNGDTLERIARKLFNDGRKWRSLYEWNREQIADPSRLRVGQTLKVKDVAVKPASLTAPRAEADVKTTEEQAPARMAHEQKVKAEEQEPASSEVQSCSTSAMMP
jgi:nucleoid-associated protein YgaU